MAGVNERSSTPPHRPNDIDAFLAELDPCTPGSSLFPQTPQRTVPQLRRGPMYSAYSQLRDTKLRRRKEGITPIPMTPTPKKKIIPLVARSVPDFSAAVRKENKNPKASRLDCSVLPLPPKGRSLEMAVTPPLRTSSTGGLRRVGSVSVQGGEEKRYGGFMGRKSYSCLKELKGFSDVSALAIDEEGRRGGCCGYKGLAMQTVPGVRQLHL